MSASGCVSVYLFSCNFFVWTFLSYQNILTVVLVVTSKHKQFQNNGEYALQLCPALSEPGYRC